MTTKPRVLVEVLDAVIAVIPATERVLLGELGKCRESASYAPPEAMRLLWARVVATLNALIGGPREAWHDEVRAIIAGEREVPEVAITSEVPIYRVRYFDRQKSRKGQGVQTKTFRDAGEAERFASQNVLYARPCKVEPVQLTRTKGVERT